MEDKILFLKMRNRLKYRVFYKKINQYLDDEWSISINRDGSINACRYYECAIDIKCEYAEQDQLVVEFCTGKKDKNSNLIYDGDIAQDPDCYENILIKWDEDDASFRLIQGNTSNEFDNCIEIIGNIHENPELLEPESEE